MGEAESISTSNGKDAHVVEEPLNPLPRSIIRRTAYELLDGEWLFEPDLEDRGLSERWYLGHEYPLTAQWPGSIESHLAATKEAQRYAPSWQDNVVGWYEREFTIPTAWCDSPDCLTQVTFGACGYETRVWLNGHPLRTIEGEEVHYGEFNSFSYELPPEFLQKVNRLTVRIADSMDAEIPRGKQESRVYNRGGIWYHTISGSVRSVWIEPIERNRLRSRLSVVSSVEDRLVEFEITTRVHDPGLYTLRLMVTPERGNEVLATAEFQLPLEAGERPQRVPLQLPDARPWSPAEPNLYHIVAQLIGPSGSLSGIETHFGLRKIEARGSQIYLNNEAVYLDGILFQPGTSTFEEMRRYMLAMKRLGCNLVRIHIAGIDPRIYDLADQMGLLLWVEVPSPHTSSQKSRDNHWAELQRMLVFIGSHPSVIILSLYNEDWGVQDIATSVETRRYIASTYDYLRSHYPQLLVVDNDGWRHISSGGRLKSNLLTAHLYTPSIDRWRELLDLFVKGQTDDVAAAPLVVGDPFFYGGQVPLVVSEWGGFGFAYYSGPEEQEEKAARIRAYKQELRRRPIAGDVYTQATSIEDENNGLIEAASGKLLVPQGLLGSAQTVSEAEVQAEVKPRQP